MLLGRVGPGAGAGLRYDLHRAESRVAPELLALESSAHADSFRLLRATVERAGEEARLAAEVNVLKLMVEGETKYDREMAQLYRQYYSLVDQNSHASIMTHLHGS